MNYDTPAWRAVLEADEADRPAVTLVLVRRLLADEPAHWPARLQLGKLLTQVARVDEARAVLLRLAEDSVGQGRTARWLVSKALGDCYAQAGAPALALAAYAHMRELKPVDAAGYVYAGALLARLGRLAEAEVMHRAGAACTEGAFDESWYNLGLVLRAQERNAEAAVALEQALAIDPDYALAHAALADVRAAHALG